MVSEPTERRGAAGLQAVRRAGTSAARRAQVRLEGRLPQISAARRNLADRQERPYASHLPVLLGLQRVQPVAAVLELGAGDFSTGTFLDRRCFPDLERLTSVEVNQAWREKVRSSLGADARLELLGEGHASTCEAIGTLDLEAFDIVFIDDSDRAVDRAASIAAIVASSPRHPLLVVHDFEVPDYRRAAAGLDHIFIFSSFNPMTGVGWNGGSRHGRAMRSLARSIDERRHSLAPDDSAAWVTALRGDRA